jgi:hypothetical protein
MSLKSKAYDDPQEAYDVLKKWNALKPEYEIMFQEKKIDHVLVLFDKKKPSHAWIHYMIGSDPCVLGLKLNKAEDISDKL